MTIARKQKGALMLSFARLHARNTIQPSAKWSASRGHRRRPHGEQSASVERNFDAFQRAGVSGSVPSPARRKHMFEDYLRWTRSTTDVVH
jgi:hypothetical protein